jgi:molecular chaperone GrpE
MSDTPIERQPELLEPSDPRDQALLRAEAEIAELRERLLRMAADNENFKKRQQRERDQAVQFANENIVTALVPSIDNFDRVFSSAAAAGADEAFLDGVRLVKKQLEDTLARFGVSFFSTLGESFDPARAEAVGMRDEPEVPGGTVVEEHERGYALHGRVVRPARVVVSTTHD